LILLSKYEFVFYSAH